MGFDSLTGSERTLLSLERLPREERRRRIEEAGDGQDPEACE